METGEMRIINICANYIKNRLKYFLVMQLYVHTYVYIHTGLSINICIIMFKYFYIPCIFYW